MIVLASAGWDQYKLLDSGNGRRLEQYGKYILNRPDPQCLWQPKLSLDEWEKADAVFEQKGWKVTSPIPPCWDLSYQDITLHARLTPFKHTGIFPEQHLHWDWMREIIKNSKLKIKNEIRVLNLFGYTGGATIACLKEGAEVVHVDASKKAIAYAKENQEASGLQQEKVHWILDDALDFVRREVRRGNIYQGIIMDPPVYGHGPDGKPWDFDKDFPELVKECAKLFDDTALFFLVNAYAISASSIMLENVVKDYLPEGVESGELAIEEMAGKRLLSTGIFARWSKK